jgi:hypothetical protein
VCSDDFKAEGGCSEREAEFCCEHCLNRNQLNDVGGNAKEKLMEIHESIAKDRKKGILRGTAQYFLNKMLPSYSGCGSGSGSSIS